MALDEALFETAGAHVMVDGQFGSTGKGVLAAWLARKALEGGKRMGAVVSNAGPNSGHTFYHGGEKHVLKQLPTFAVASYLMGEPVQVCLSSGAVIDPGVLLEEAARYPRIPIMIDPAAAVIQEADRVSEHEGSIAAVAGTRSGTGAALARKIARNPSAVASAWRDMLETAPNVRVKSIAPSIRPDAHPVFLEVSQGFSLGINSEFYPKVTSRECTVMQAIADARIPAQLVSKVYMAIRTFPIRVGNIDGHNSGGCYSDQEEISWSSLGVEPELTTVTKRPRRVFTFSDIQFGEALRANMPDLVFVNFMNYLAPSQRQTFARRLARIGGRWGYKPFETVFCDGPTSDHVSVIPAREMPMMAPCPA